ncbi:hypothetical protein PHET_09955 [Paragonimus heterotremus]|uniref:Uncharacterized protein n=1 Tax=Paragonimus heterotremus TaxID=100268 RepID=A0A8J4WN33_9TREM|nr:hypothetical protein PHET_09955 [Paragonimus heterotremus]
MRLFIVIAVLSTLVNASHKESVRLISLNADLSLRDLELIDVHPNFLRRRAQIEQTTGSLLELINRHKILNNHVFPFGSIVYGKSDHPDWSYENYLAQSVLHVVSRAIQFFEACYFEEYGGLQPVACFMPVRRKTLCEEKKFDSFVHAVRHQVQSEIRSTGNERNDTAVVRSIFLSNCGEHQKASTLLLKLTQSDPTNPYYRFVLSELLSRQDKVCYFFHCVYLLSLAFVQRKLGLTLEHINEAIRLNSSEVQYREKRLTLYLSRGLIDDARLDAEWIRAHAEEHLRGKYCTYCSRKRVKKTVSPLAWRPWFVIGLFDLIASNGTQAERDFTVALDLALSVKLPSDQEISFSVSSILRHLKAISLHNVNKFADAMETAVLNAHVNPSALDAVLLISQTLARASMFDRALIMLDLALPLMDSISMSASSAGYVEVLTDVLSIRRVTLQLRSWIHYRLGDILKAEADARVSFVA